MKAVLCSNPLCDQRESLWRPWLQPVVRRGVFWDRQWYCSPECLQEAVLPIIQRFWEGSTQEPPDVKKSRLGVILVEKGIITQDQLDLALEKQVQEGGSTGEWLRLSVSSWVFHGSTRSNLISVGIYSTVFPRDSIPRFGCSPSNSTKPPGLW